MAAGMISPCIVTGRMAAPCDRCGRPASPVHMPRREHGLYCTECCPVCSNTEASGPGQKRIHRLKGTSGNHAA